MSGPPAVPLKEIARLFLQLGATAFGGPAAHIALMEQEVVARRRWMTRADFLDLLGATNLIPGPNSTEMAIHIGRVVGGWRGLVLAGACFIAPAALITGAIAWAYVRFGKLPDVAALLYGAKPVIVAVVAQAIWRLGRVVLKGPALVALGVAALAASLAGVDELLVLGCAGALALVLRRLAGGTLSGAIPLLAAGALPAAAAAVPFSLGALFLFFAKVGSVLFGSGYVLLAFLRADLVERWRWLSDAQLLDAIAVGQFTPGPVFSTATFIGYLLAGAPGAAVATAGIFLPAFFFVAVSGPIVPRLRASALAGAVLDGVNVASLALMVAVALRLGTTALVDVKTVALALAALLALRSGVNSAWIVLAGAVAGWLLAR